MDFKNKFSKFSCEKVTFSNSSLSFLTNINNTQELLRKINKANISCNKCYLFKHLPSSKCSKFIKIKIKIQIITITHDL